MTASTSSLQKNAQLFSSFPQNTIQGTTYGWLGQHQKQTETDFTLSPTQMGARVYLASIGRFLQVDPIEGGTPNNYVYPPDPVSDFDLSGEMGWKTFATIASVGSFVPGPIGMVASGVAAAAYAAAGDKKAALQMVAGIALASVGAGAIAGTFRAVKVANVVKVKDALRIAPYSRLTGMNSRLFGSGKTISGTKMAQGFLVKNKGIIRFGWSQDRGNPVFRIGIGHHPHYQKNIVHKIIGHHHFDLRRFGWRL